MSYVSAGKDGFLKLRNCKIPHGYLQFVELHLDGLSLDAGGRSLRYFPCGVGDPGEELGESVVKLAQLEEGVLQLVFPVQSVRVEFGPRRTQLV